MTGKIDFSLFTSHFSLIFHTLLTYFSYLCTIYNDESMPTLEIAIVDSNILSALGLQPILTDIIPGVEVNCFISFDDLQTADHGQFVHYFVASRIYFEHVAYFRENGRRIIVLVNGELQVAGVPTLNVCQPENALVKSLLAVHRKGHPHGVPSHGKMPHHPHQSPSLLSQREIEVAILLARGFINKEIADRLCISVTTVITHRKNIMEKLGARSLADIIIYVVMNGLVDVGEL